MSTLRNLALLAAPVAVALVAWSCEPQPNALAPNIGTPLAHFQPGNFVCTPLKMTGGDGEGSGEVKWPHCGTPASEVLRNNGVRRRVGVPTVRRFSYVL